jgi:hypothetical protein
MIGAAILRYILQRLHLDSRLLNDKGESNKNIIFFCHFLNNIGFLREGKLTSVRY